MQQIGEIVKACISGDGENVLVCVLFFFKTSDRSYCTLQHFIVYCPCQYSTIFSLIRIFNELYCFKMVYAIFKCANFLVQIHCKVLTTLYKTSFFIWKTIWIVETKFLRNCKVWKSWPVWMFRTIYVYILFAKAEPVFFF